MINITIAQPCHCQSTIMEAIDLTFDEDADTQPLSPCELSEDEDLFEPIGEEEEEPMPPPPPRFRINCKQLFLTYPQCSADKQVVLTSIIEKLDPEWAIVCREAHEDGTPHLHCVIVLKKPKNIRGFTLLDSIAGQHGNYQAARNLLKVISYVTKTSEYVAYQINLPQYLAKAAQKKNRTKSKADIVAARIGAGESLFDINASLPGYVMIHKRKLEEYAAWTSLKRQRESKLEWKVPALDTHCAFSQEYEILEWIIQNIKTDRTFKQEQLWVWGDRGTGKTSLIHWLEKFLVVYWIPHEDFDDDYEDGCYDLAVCDEFKGTRKITWLNRFVQGGAMRLRKKGTQGMKRDNIPVIILSNYPIQYAYSCNVPDIAKRTLECRFTEVMIPADEQIRFYNSL